MLKMHEFMIIFVQELYLMFILLFVNILLLKEMMVMIINFKKICLIFWKLKILLFLMLWIKYCRFLLLLLLLVIGRLFKKLMLRGITLLSPYYSQNGTKKNKKLISCFSSLVHFRICSISSKISKFNPRKK